MSQILLNNNHYNDDTKEKKIYNNTLNIFKNYTTQKATLHSLLPASHVAPQPKRAMGFAMSLDSSHLTLAYEFHVKTKTFYK